MKIGIIAYQDCTASMILGLMDILALANTQVLNKTKGLFEVTVISRDGNPAKSFNGYPVACSSSIRSKRIYDIIYVPGFLADPMEVLSREIAIVKWLKTQSDHGAQMTAACNGNLMIAEAGILKNKRATTHWSLKEFFEKRYPDTFLQPEKIIVDEGGVVSAAGVTAYMNLALHLIARHGSHEIASYCSKVFW